MRKQQGFTLIEVLIYLGLFAVLMSGMLFSVLLIVEGGHRSQAKVTLQQEGDFIMSKLNQALNEAKTLTVTGTELDVEMWTGPNLVFDTSSGNLTLDSGGGALPLNNTNTQVSGLNFTHQGAGTSQEILTATLTLNTRTEDGKVVSEDFETTKYLKGDTSSF
jgi:prepilin-type N-terminal cleavage/methylation domain-containing protein